MLIQATLYSVLLSSSSVAVAQLVVLVPVLICVLFALKYLPETSLLSFEALHEQYFPDDGEISPLLQSTD